MVRLRQNSRLTLHTEKHSINSKLLQQLLLQPFYSSLDFVWDNPDELVSDETFTHSHISWSSIIPNLLPPSFMIHSILLVQFMCLTVFFHNLSPSFLWSTSWPGTLHFILHTFLHPIIVFFSQHMQRELENQCSPIDMHRHASSASDN